MSGRVSRQIVKDWLTENARSLTRDELESGNTLELWDVNGRVVGIIDFFSHEDEHIGFEVLISTEGNDMAATMNSLNELKQVETSKS